MIAWGFMAFILVCLSLYVCIGWWRYFYNKSR